VTISIGVAVYPADGTDPRTLIARAVASNAEAKKAGKNRVALAAGTT
jgi:GGDEF domain-containing protein